MKYLTIKPLLGTRNNCPADSPSMYKVLDQFGNIIATHAAGGQNFDLERENDSCSKAYGRSQWSNSANAEATRCLGLHELWDGTNRKHFYFDNGKVYKFDDSRDQDDVTGALTFAKADDDLYSIIQYGNYMIFADHGTTTPYKIDHDDAAISKLIASGTEYIFRYLLNFTNRIIGLYSDQTNGHLDIRWTNALAETTFPAANQLYKAGDSITGAHQLGHNTAFIFGETDIYRMDYYSSATPVFTLIRVLKGWGSANHQGIASDGINLYPFDLNRGFYKFNGSTEPVVISDPIESTIARMNRAYYNLITHAVIPFTNEIVWNVALDAAVTPSHLLFYNYKTGQWRMEVKAARYLNNWRMFSDITWNDLIVLTDDIWPSQGSWSYYTSESNKLVWGNSNGHLYSHASEGDDGSNWDGYRIEPILPFLKKRKENKIRILEIWADIAEKQSHSLDFYYRGGNTLGEVEQKSWESLGLISMNSPANAVLYTDKLDTLSHIKWGTDLKSEPFSVNELRIGYVEQGPY